MTWLTRAHARGKTHVVLVYGLVIGGGIVTTGLVMLAMLLSGNARLLVEVEAGLYFAGTAMTVGPIIGVFIGHELWVRAERAAGRDFEEERRAAVLPSVDRADDTQRALDELTVRLRALVERDPAEFDRRARRMIWLGYAYVLALVALLLAAAIALFRTDGVDLRFAFFLALFAWTILSSFRIQWMEMEGSRVTAAVSPALFGTLQRIQQALDAPAPHTVRIDSELNAAVQELPRILVFGPFRRTLTIGLPLAECGTVEEFEAILAHEMAHLARRDASTGMSMSGIAATWGILALQMQAGRHIGRWLLMPFFRWYAPRLELFAGATTRRQEFASDALAARVVGVPAMAASLIRMSATQAVLTELFWPTVWSRTATQAEPSADPFDGLWSVLHSAPADAIRRRALRRALAERSEAGDSHPSLRERLEALGVPLAEGDAGVDDAMRLLAPVERSTAEAMLSEDRARKVRRQLGEHWAEANAAKWKQLHVAYAQSQSPTGHDLSDRWARAQWTAECRSAAEAIPLLRDVLALDPSHTEAALLLGRSLMEADEPASVAEGVQHTESVMRRDALLAVDAADLLARHYGRTGRPEDRARALTRKRQIETAALVWLGDLDVIAATDVLEPVPLTSDVAEALRRACASEPTIGRAYLVDRFTDSLRHQPMRVLIIEFDLPWHHIDDGKVGLELQERLSPRLERATGTFIQLRSAPPRTGLRRRLRAMPGAEVFASSR